MKTLTDKVDLNEEVTAIAAFLTQKWEPLPGLALMVAEIRDAALHAARGWIERFDVGHEAHEMAKIRTDILKNIDAPQDAQYYDAYIHFLEAVWDLDETVMNVGLNLDGPWDYSKRVKRLAWSLTDRFPGLTALKPLGYNDAKLLDVHDLTEAYQPGPDRDLFEGSKVEGVLSGTFPMRVALPYVLAEEGQGYEPWVTLVGSLYSQFLGLAKHHNMLGLMDALKTAMPYHATAVQFKLPEKVENPFLQMFLTLAGPAPAEIAYLGALRYRESLSLPAADRAKHINDQPEQLKAYMADIESRRQRYAARWPAKKDEYVQLLTAALEQAK